MPEWTDHLFIDEYKGLALNRMCWGVVNSIFFNNTKEDIQHLVPQYQHHNYVCNPHLQFVSVT